MTLVYKGHVYREAGTSSEVEAIIREADLTAFGGECGWTAVYINDLLLSGEGTYLAVVNSYLWDTRDELVGHVVVEYDGVLFDGTGIVTLESLSPFGDLTAALDDELASWTCLGCDAHIPPAAGECPHCGDDEPMYGDPHDEGENFFTGEELQAILSGADYAVKTSVVELDREDVIAKLGEACPMPWAIEEALTVAQQKVMGR